MIPLEFIHATRFSAVSLFDKGIRVVTVVLRVVPPACVIVVFPDP